MTFPLRTRRSAFTAPVAALLLLSLGLAGGALGLVHASDRIAAPSAIEAEHGQGCVVLHDPARCPGCQVAGVATLPESTRAAVDPPARVARPLAPAFAAMPSRVFRGAAAPRAPPLSLSV